MIKILDDILLSENVLEKFNTACENPEFKAWINSILPEIFVCRQTNQDNPWHIYNCYEHILNSVSHMNAQTINLSNETRRLLSYTMFFHDLGKPECKIRRYSTLYKRYVDSFPKHNLASVKIAQRVLPSLNFNSREIEIIKKLVEEHDMFMFITLKENNNPYHHVLSKDYIKQKINELNTVFNGEKMLEYLILIARADNKSQNPKMTKGSFELIDKFEKMLS